MDDSSIMDSLQGYCQLSSYGYDIFILKSISCCSHLMLVRMASRAYLSLREKFHNIKSDKIKTLADLEDLLLEYSSSCISENYGGTKLIQNRIHYWRQRKWRNPLFLTEGKGKYWQLKTSNCACSISLLRNNISKLQLGKRKIIWPRAQEEEEEEKEEKEEKETGMKRI